MDSDLFEVLLVIAFILFGLLGSRKKKKPASRAGLPAPSQTRRPGREITAQTRRQVNLEELSRMLETARRPARGAASPSREPPAQSDAQESVSWMAGLEQSARSQGTSEWEAGLKRATEARETPEWEAGLERAPVTLETLEGAGDESHRRFHQRYDRPRPAAPPQARTALPAGTTLRRAIVWSEILAPPVSLRD